MQIQQLLTNAVIPDEAAHLIPTALTANPKNITHGTLFFLTEGVSFDTSKLLPYILAKKPLAVVINSEIEVEKADVPLIRVPSVRRAYAEAFFLFCGLDKARLKYIAVTGTNGKTTTAMMLREILMQSGHAVGWIGTGRILCKDMSLCSPFYSMTTPDPDVLYPALAKMEMEGCEYVVMEASSHALALEKLAPIFFTLSIFTNLSAEHLDFHKTMERYFLAKAQLFLQSECGILNSDDAYARRIAAKSPCRTIGGGALYPTEIALKNIERNKNGTYSYMFKSKGPTFFVHLKIPGIYHVYNSMLALSAAIELGIAPCLAKKAIESIEAIAGRMQSIENDALSVFLDYAHTPEALSSALKEARATKKDGQTLWLVFGCGGERDREKRPKMAEIAECFADRVILTLDNCRGESPMQILKDTVCGFQSRESIRIISDRKKAIRHAVLSMKSKDILIIAGKGHETYNIDKSGYHPFDERKIVRDALKERKEGHTVLYEN